MIRLVSLLPSAALALLVTACGGGGGDPDANITFFDAGPPDAPPPPDAFVCVETDTTKNCGPTMADCVNITTDEANCGGCDMPCQAGAGCTAGPSEGGDEVAHCECPTAVVTGDINSVPPETLGLPINAMNEIPGQPGDWAGFGLFFGGDGSADGILATFSEGDADAGTSGTELNTPIDLATVTGNVPSIGIGHNFDQQTFQPQGAYRATSGTISYSVHCPAGAAGTVTDGVFEAVSDFTNPDAPPVEGGCSFMASFDFTVGAPNSCPTP